MFPISTGDLVQHKLRRSQMLVIGSANESADDPLSEALDDPDFFCVWEEGQLLHEEVFASSDLILVRKERRRVPRLGILPIPVTEDKSSLAPVSSERP